MVLNKGGYVMINKAQDNVYELATSALTSGKPILWYESNTECYFIDTIKLNGTDIVLTKGGKTITIENDGDITESGEIQTHLYALTFNVSDMYYTIITTKASGLNNVVINTNTNDRSILTLTNEQEASLYSAFKNALQASQGQLLNNISGDESFDYGSYSTITEIDFRNSGISGYSLQIQFNNDNIEITTNENDGEITIYEHQIF